MKAFGWVADWQGCGTYRLIMPFNMLDERDFGDVSYGARLDLEETYDVVIGQRVSRDGASRHFQRLAESPDTKAVFEIDDLLTDVHPKNRRAHRYYGQDEVKERILRNIEAADHVIVSTEFLADTYGKANPNISVFPNCVDETIISMPRPERPDGRLKIGWAGGSSHAIDFEHVRYPLRLFFKRNPDAVFHTIGWDAGEFLGLPEDQRMHTPWQTSIPEYLRALDFDIGIAPLRPMDFNRGKSHVKALEYAARGIPTVASDFDPYNDFVQHESTGLLCRYDKDWVDALDALANDDTKRSEMTQASRKYAGEWTIQRRISEYEQILSAL